MSWSRQVLHTFCTIDAKISPSAWRVFLTRSFAHGHGVWKRRRSSRSGGGGRIKPVNVRCHVAATLLPPLSSTRNPGLTTAPWNTNHPSIPWKMTSRSLRLLRQKRTTAMKSTNGTETASSAPRKLPGSCAKLTSGWFLYCLRFIWFSIWIRIASTLPRFTAWKREPNWKDRIIPGWVSIRCRYTSPLGRRDTAYAFSLRIDLLYWISRGTIPIRLCAAKITDWEVFEYHNIEYGSAQTVPEP